MGYSPPHRRMREKASKPPTAFEKRVRERIRTEGCLVCRAPATIHHVTGYADRPGRFSRSESLIVPLCAMHHQKVFDPKASDPVSVEGLSHQGFYTRHGIDLLAEAMRLWDKHSERETA